jgi:hypothetical protein
MGEGLKVRMWNIKLEITRFWKLKSNLLAYTELGNQLLRRFERLSDPADRGAALP